MRTESLWTWAVGAVLGALVGAMVLLGGSVFLLLAVAFVTLAFVAARSLALLSGTFIGVGGAWLALTLRARLACDAFDAEPNQGCTGFGAEPFAVISVVVLAVGILLGVLAQRRRRSQARSHSGEAPLSR
jgi:hypothetical protein